MRKQTFGKALLLLSVICLCALLFCACDRTKPSGTPEKNDPSPNDCFKFTLLADGTFEIAVRNNALLPASVRLPATYEGIPVTRIADYAFSDLSHLESITIPDSITGIGWGAFHNCTRLTEMALPNSVTMLDKETFSGCSSLISVTIGNNVTSIGDRAFSGCSSLTSIAIPGSVTSIGSYAFYGCHKLVEVYNLSQLAIDKASSENGYVGYYALNIYTPTVGQSKLTHTKDGYIFYADETTVCLLGYTGAQTRLALPADFGGKQYEVYQYAFSGNAALISIIVPDGVTALGSSAFDGCASLVSITIGSTVTNIGDQAFNGCYKLVEVYNRSGLSIAKGSAGNGYVAYYALNVYTPASGESKLTDTNNGYIFYADGDTVCLLGYTGTQTKLSLPADFNGKKYEIYQYAFSGSSSLTSVDIPKSVTALGYGAFLRCSALTAVTIADGATSIGNFAFMDCTSLESITIPDSVTTLGNQVFYRCSSLASIAIPDGVTKIGNQAFFGCSSLSSVTLPDSVTSIGDRAFYNCSLLITVTIPKNVTSIGDSAFAGCGKLVEVYNRSGLSITKGSNKNGYVAGYALNVYTPTDGESKLSYTNGYIFYADGDTVWLLGYTGTKTRLTLPSGFNGKNYAIYHSAFTDFSSLSEITIPKGITAIGDFAFSGCSSLTGVTIPDGVTSIGYRAFSGCSSLTSIAIPDSVTSIGELVFSGCSSLTSITIPDSVTSIGDHAFSGCSSLTSITIPDRVTSIGILAFEGCSSLAKVTFMNTSGWMVSKYSNMRDSISVDVGDPATAATSLTSTYCDCYWQRS